MRSIISILDQFFHFLNLEKQICQEITCVILGKRKYTFKGIIISSNPFSSNLLKV